jgi:hypothetical protein
MKRRLNSVAGEAKHKRLIEHQPLDLKRGQFRYKAQADACAMKLFLFEK